MYAVVLGFLITTIVGYSVSNILRLFDMQGDSKIYVNDNSCNINADLFVPPIAKRIRKRNAKNEDLLGNRGGEINVSFEYEAIDLNLTNFFMFFSRLSWYQTKEQTSSNLQSKTITKLFTNLSTILYNLRGMCLNLNKTKMSSIIIVLTIYCSRNKVSIH